MSTQTYNRLTVQDEMNMRKLNLDPTNERHIEHYLKKEKMDFTIKGVSNVLMGFIWFFGAIYVLCCWANM